VIPWVVSCLLVLCQLRVSTGTGGPPAGFRDVTHVASPRTPPA
jgi:hypothetical protein